MADKASGIPADIYGVIQILKLRILSTLLLFAIVSWLQSNPALGADFAKAFHVAGVPDVKRGKRIDITLGADDLVIDYRGVPYVVPYSRIKQAMLLHANRNYEKTTVAAAAIGGAFGVPGGGILLLINHKVDTVIVDYENQSHGRMGFVVQVEKGKGRELADLLAKHNVMIAEPPGDTRSKTEGPQ